jgi:hypothetical protein
MSQDGTIIVTPNLNLATHLVWAPWDPTMLPESHRHVSPCW